MTRRILFLNSLILFCTALYATETKQETQDRPPETTPVSLSELAARADLVAVAQVKDTDYVYARAFPNEGSAFLKILIAYKLNNPVEEIIEVYEKGLHPHECYFENPTVFEEGRRYLVFFQLDPEYPELYRGLAEGCALEIFVREDHRYALKYPVEGIELTDKLDELVEAYDFHDNYAVVADDELTPVDREKLLVSGLVIPYQDGFKYTHGIDLGTVRGLIDAKALKSKRTW